MIKPTKPTKKPLFAVQAWREAKKNLSEARTYENAVALQRSSRQLRDSIKTSISLVRI